jgi:hypothetical protein
MTVERESGSRDTGGTGGTREANGSIEVTDVALVPPVPQVPLVPENGEEVVDENPKGVVRRIRITSVCAYFAFAVFVAISHGFRDVLGLTCSALVTMIAFLWLEEIAELIFQPAAAHQHARRLMWRTLARFALLGVALWVTIFVARFDPLSVLLGFSIVVVGIMGEALYAVFRSFPR